MELDINTDRPAYKQLQAVIEGISEKRKTLLNGIGKNLSALKADKTALEQRLKEERQKMLTAQISGDAAQQKEAESEIETLSAQIKEISIRIENYSGIDVFEMLLPEFDAVRAAAVSSVAADEERRHKISEHIGRLEKLDQEIQNKIQHYYSIRDLDIYQTGANDLSYLFAPLLHVSNDAMVVRQLISLFGFYSNKLDYTRPLPDQIKEKISEFGTAGNDY